MTRPDNAYRPFTAAGRICSRTKTRWNLTGKSMLDLFSLILGTGFIASMAAYANLCDRI